MLLLDQIITFLLICLLCYQIFLAHVHLNIIEGYELVLPKFSPAYSSTMKPVAKPIAIPVNNFLPKTQVSMDFDPNSVLTQIT
jgi:hypothetical protein